MSQGPPDEGARRAQRDMQAFRDAPIGMAVVATDERILLVEDEPALLALGDRVLTQAGYEVHLAHDGAAAVRRAAAAGALDLLITDVTMPDIHGPRLADILHQSRPDLSVLFISGHASGAVPSGGDAAHVDFLAKPFRPDELLRRVQGLLERRHRATG